MRLPDAATSWRNYSRVAQPSNSLWARTRSATLALQNDAPMMYVVLGPLFQPSTPATRSLTCPDTPGAVRKLKSGLAISNTLRPASGLAFVPRANAQDERKQSYTTLLIQHIDPSITFRALGTGVGSLLREHISSTQSRSGRITRIAGARSHQAAT